MIKIMHHIFIQILGVCVYIYINDICICSDTYEQHVQDVEKVLSILHDNHFTASKKKFAFMPATMEVPGCTITRSAISAAPDKMETIANFPVSDNCGALQEFNRRINHYSCFLPQLSTWSAPLTELAGATAVTEWHDIHTAAFYCMKILIAGNAIVQPINYQSTDLIHLVTNASAVGIEA